VTLRCYERYKDSGVDWLGPVPVHWQVLRLSRLTSRIASGKTPLGGSETYVQDGVLFLRSQNVHDDGLRLDDVVYIADLVDESMASSRVFSGDILLNITGASIGRTCIVPPGFPRANVNQHVCAIRPIDPEHAGFISWFLKSAQIKGQIDAVQEGAAREGLNFDQIEKFAIPLPPHLDRIAICSFLLRETAKIDTLIAEQQRLIELLTEKRQAVIAHAVTKGLNPSAPMKDSGVEWLGEVPAHWNVQPLKHVADFRSGGTPDKTNLDYWDGAVPWASAKDLKVDGLFDTTDHVTDEALAVGAAALVPVNSVLVVVRGMILARMFPVVIARAPMAINQDLKAVIAKASMDGEYLAWLLRASAAESLSRLDEAGHGTKALRMDAWGAMRVPVPPLLEQIQIARQLARTCATADAGLDDVQRGIALLRERRTALISAAVTGQIDLRDRASLDAALAETRDDIAAGRYVVESAAAHVARVQALARVDEQAPSPPGSC
jgi:type I restriction enzyme S subunit